MAKKQTQPTHEKPSLTIKSKTKSKAPSKPVPAARGYAKLLKQAEGGVRQEVVLSLYELLKKVTDDNHSKHAESKLNSKDIDAQYKIAASIRKLCDEETIFGYIQAFTPFLKWLREDDPLLARKLTVATQKFLACKAQELQ